MEAENNVGINFEENENKDAFVISGRGELMLEILLTQMRREGFEMTVSPPKVLIRKNQVKRALINILDNANKFAENIYLSSTIQNDNWLISVEDDGPGTNLTEEQLVRPFVKGSEQLNQGTGLGLSIVQKLIKLNNEVI